MIEQRLRLGDFEGDTVLGPPGTGGVATVVCRKSRLTMVAKVRSKDSEHVYDKLKQRLKELDEERRHSITLTTAPNSRVATGWKNTWALSYTLLIRAVRISAARTKTPMA